MKKVINLIINDGDELRVDVLRNDEMTLAQFWRVIDEYGKSFLNTPLTKGEVSKFDHLFTMLDEYAQSVLKPYWLKHWMLSDDGFQYLIWWIISQGRDFYNNALVHPESLGEDQRAAELFHSGETFRYAVRKALDNE